MFLLLDTHSAGFQVLFCEGDLDKIIFIISLGWYRYTKLLFVLPIASATFTRALTIISFGQGEHEAQIALVV